MSLVTRCPACGTAFKVVRDQLRISDGWVRCGRCSEVFDALPALEGTEEAGEAGHPVPVPSSWPDARLLDFTAAALPQEAPPAEAAPPPLQAPFSLPGAEDRAGNGEGSGSGFSRPELLAIAADDPWPMLPAPVLGEVPSPVDEAVDAQLQKALRRTRIQALREARRREHAQGLGAPAAAEVPVAALREASSDGAAPAAPPVAGPAASALSGAPAADTTPARPPSARGALLWGTAIVLTALALVFQVLRHERDALRAAGPAWQPVLAAVCALSGCELGPLRRIDAVRIEGSGFTPQRDAPGYRLDFTLRSAAAQPLVMPSVELALLDSSERPVARRVLHPRDVGAPAVMAPHAEQVASVPMVLQPPEDVILPAVIGYRLVLFYP
ncbi:MAG: zinc-ribbon and DUF3426 domain-containing protein [Xenophilus sp.]